MITYFLSAFEILLQLEETQPFITMKKTTQISSELKWEEKKKKKISHFQELAMKPKALVFY